VMSAAAIAALELREPDDAKKNAVFLPVPHPVVPADFLRCTQTTIRNQDRAVRTLGLWPLRKRLSAIHHMGLLGILRFALQMWRQPVPDDAQIEVLIAAG